MWHFVRFAAVLWNGLFVGALAWMLATDGNINFAAHGPETMAAGEVVLFLIGFGCSLALALKARVNTIKVAPESLPSSNKGRAEP